MASEPSTTAPMRGPGSHNTHDVAMSRRTVVASLATYLGLFDSMIVRVGKVGGEAEADEV